MKTAAFFDVDGTLFKGNTGLAYTRWLFFKRRIPLRLAYKVFKGYVMYRLNRFEAFDFYNRTFFFIKGWDAEETKKLFGEYFERKLSKKLSRNIVSELLMHKEKGRVIVIVTNSQLEMVYKLKDILGADYLVTSEFEVKNGRYTGKMKAICYGYNKPMLMKDIAEKEKVNMKKSYAYSDSFSDLPMLGAVGNPVAVSPDRKLRKHAKENGWQIMRI